MVSQRPRRTHANCPWRRQQPCPLGSRNMKAECERQMRKMAHDTKRSAVNANKAADMIHGMLRGV